MAAAVATKEVVALPQDFRRGVVLPTTDDDDLIPLTHGSEHFIFWRALIIQAESCDVMLMLIFISRAKELTQVLALSENTSSPQF